jgi:hypothetical protein
MRLPSSPGDIVEALHRGEGILSILEMSRLSGVSRQDIYRIFQSRSQRSREPMQGDLADLLHP